MLVLGDKEVESKSVSARKYSEQDSKEYTIDDFAARIIGEVNR
jgi:threonyl-tRNA synthetase